MNQGVPPENFLAIGASARGVSMVEHGLLAITLIWITPHVTQNVTIKVKPTRAQVKDHTFRTREEKEPLETGSDVSEKIEEAVSRIQEVIKDCPFPSTRLLLFGIDSFSAARYYYDLARVRPNLLQRPWHSVEYIQRSDVPFVLTEAYVKSYLSQWKRFIGHKSQQLFS